MRWPRIGAAVAVAAAAAATTLSCSNGQPAAGPTTASTAAQRPGGTAAPRVEIFEVPAGAGPHDVAPARDGGIWFTAQSAGYLGHLDPDSRRVTQVPLGSGSRPHGVIVGGDGAAWVTDSGLNAIVRVDGDSREVRRFPLPSERPDVNLNTAAFDRNGVLWFTGQAGFYGRLDPRTGDLRVFDAPGGRGPYGIAATASGDVYYASLAGNHIARIDVNTGAVARLQPPTAGQGARRVWPDSQGRVWVSEYNAGQLGRYDPATGQWREWKLPGSSPRPYAVYVDDKNVVWLSDFGADTVVRFDPASETFSTVDVPGGAGNVRQLLGRPGELWCPASARNLLFLVRT